MRDRVFTFSLAVVKRRWAWLPGRFHWRLDGRISAIPISPAWPARTGRSTCRVHVRRWPAKSRAAFQFHARGGRSGIPWRAHIAGVVAETAVAFSAGKAKKPVNALAPFLP